MAKRSAKSDIVIEHLCPHCGAANELHFVPLESAEVAAQTAYTHCKGCTQLMAVRMTEKQLLEVSNERN